MEVGGITTKCVDTISKLTALMQVPRALHAFNILLDNARLDVEAHHCGRRFAIDLAACNEDEAVLERCGHKAASIMSC